MVFIGCSAFEVNGWERETNDINEAIKFYKEKWGYCWAEDKKGNVFYKIPLQLYHANYNCSYMDLPF